MLKNACSWSSTLHNISSFVPHTRVVLDLIGGVGQRDAEEDEEAESDTKLKKIR
jgi:hypothetical protein